MTARTTQFVPLLIAILAIIIAYTIRSMPGALALQASLHIFNPLFLFSIYALIPCLFMPFTSPATYRLLVKFSVVWLVVLALVIAFVPLSPQTGGTYNLLASTQHNDVRLLGEAYALLSLLLISVKTLFEHRARA
jgi:hypothetical protein